MKQKMKKMWLFLCMMALCLTALAGCSAANQDEDEIDPQVQMTIAQAVPQTLDALVSLSDEELAAQLAQAGKQKDFVTQSMLQSWESAKDDLGGLISSEDPTIEVSDDGYIARMNTVFEKRACVFTVVIEESSNQLSLSSVSFTPAYTMGEKMTKAGLNTLMGLGIVFCVLVLFTFIISCFKYISVFEDKMKNKGAGQAAAPASGVSAAQKAAEEAREEEDRCELIAVIAAAIEAASRELGVAPSGLVVRSIKRIENSNWK